MSVIDRCFIEAFGIVTLLLADDIRLNGTERSDTKGEDMLFWTGFVLDTRDTRHPLHAVSQNRNIAMHNAFVH